jgi:hypothetical protein
MPSTADNSCRQNGSAAFVLRLNTIAIFLKNAATHKMAIYRLSIKKIRLRFS